jgi:hypothetical protein
MRFQNFCLRAGFGLLLLAVPSVAFSQTIKCESNDGKRHYCGTYAPNQVTMSRQISGSPCQRDRSWGVDNRGLWVDNGCRAEFYVATRPGGPGGPPPPPPPPGNVGWWQHGPSDPWPPSGNWQGGNWGRGGVCVYKSQNFNGDYMCFRRGDSRSSLGNFGGEISSIRTFGGARVTVYNDRNFQGPRSTTNRDIADLRNWKVPNMGNHTWNNRISSLRVD